MAFAHLHLHTEFSLLDGACRIKQVLDKAQALGQTAVAITDHGSMYGVVDFYKEAKRRGIKPIIGCEVYVAKRSRFDKIHEFDGENRHLVLLCETQQGYQNLITMVSKAWTEGFYNRPRVDLGLLEEYHEGLIALSACLAGEIPRALMRGDREEAKACALRYQEIFGTEHFFLELQDHQLEDQRRVNQGLYSLSQETGIPLVVTNDCHYIDREDSLMHHVLMCIQTGRTVEDKDALEFGSEEFYFKSEEEMRALFPGHPEAADNTAKIAERCQVDFEFGVTKLPRFVTPDGSDNKVFFEKLCREGMQKRYGGSTTEEMETRLQYEIDTISSMGYVNYYLIVWDFIRYAKSEGIPVGPGRGSGVGSLAAYCMGITGVDPLGFHLIFERFLNPERVSMPDFDIDFSDERRQEIIEYVVGKYGADHVAQIVTFGTMAARGALRDVGRALNIPYHKVDQIAKLVPMELSVTLDKALKNSNEFKTRYQEDAQVKTLVDMAKKLEGMPRHASTHAAGVVITDLPVTAYVPLAKNDDAVVTQFTMTAIEELGLLKMDFLGLRNLSVIDHTEKMIEKNHPGFSMESIPMDDGKVFEMLSTGATEGVFQFESSGMKRLMVQSLPESMEDLTALISLYRPGPMQFIPSYLESRRDPGKIKYKHPLLQPILEVTYGSIIYQEQVMQIFRELAGYSLGRADIVRRAMSKKKHEVLEKERQVFLHGLVGENGIREIDGCIFRGVPEEVASTLFREISSFASYAFNKSHAAAYAVLAYQTAYLKFYYPSEYMAALLSSVLGATGKVAEYIEECSRLKIGVLPPHVNYSDHDFTVVQGDIRFGLQAVKNLGRGVISRMMEERRRNGNFLSFYDFCKRMSGRDLNRKAIESLIKCGSLDGLGSNRREMLLSMEGFLNALEGDRQRNVEGQLGFFDTPSAPSYQEPTPVPAEDFSQEDKLAMEKEVTGMYLSGHPMAAYAAWYQLGKYARLDEILRSAQGDSPMYIDNQDVMVLGIVAAVKRKTTKNNTTMAFVQLEDMYGAMELLVFPKTLEEYGKLFVEGKALSLRVRISFTDEKEPKLICGTAEKAKELAPGEKAEAEKRVNPGLYVKVKSLTDPLYQKATQYIAVFEGQEDVYFTTEDTGKTRKAAAQNRVSMNRILLRELQRLLGEDRVVYVAK